MDRKFLVLFLSLLTLPVLAREPRVFSQQAIDIYNRPVANIHYPGLAFELTANGNSNTVSDKFKNLLGNGDSAYGDAYILSCKARDNNARWAVGASPTVNGTTGTFQSNSERLTFSVIATEKIALIGNGGSTNLNCTRME